MGRERSQGLDFQTPAQSVDVGVAPYTLGRVRSENAVYTPGMEIIHRSASDRLERYPCGIQCLVILTPADRANPSLIVQVDRLSSGSRLYPAIRTPANIGLIQKDIFRVGDDGKLRPSVDRVVVQLLADCDDGFPLDDRAQPVPFTCFQFRSDPNGGSGRISREVVLIDQL